MAELAWVLSAPGAPALRATARELAAWLAERDGAGALDVARSLAERPPAGERRAVVLGSDRAELVAGLEALAAGRPAAGLVEGEAPARRRVALAFSGHGAQWRGMGLELWDTAPAFGAAMDACAAALDEVAGLSLREALASELERVEVVQPALFAVAVALAALWRAYGVAPEAVAGHSQGEVAAAHVAGALSLDDAARVVALRARALGELSGRGGMVALAVAPADAERRIARWSGRIALAAVNGPRSVVVGGEPAALGELLEACAADEVRARRVAMDYASHGPAVERLRARLLRELAPIRPRAAELAIASAGAGGLVAGEDLGPEHWYRSERERVRFDAAVRALAATGIDAFLEASPHPLLVAPIEDTAPGVAAVGSLRRGDGGLARFVRSLAEAWVTGVEIDWAALAPGGERVELPAPAGAPARAPALDRRAALELVVAHVAAMLGERAEVEPARPFRELGFDSAAAVELRNRLQGATGVPLPATLVYDHPTPAAVADLLVAGGRSEPRAVAARRRASAGEPVAIVGMACRFPGGIRSAADLWHAVATGRDATGGFPADRGWDLDALHDPDGERPGTTYVRRGGFLDDVAGFDAEFFGVGPREALAMDPQQRLLLEVAWEALEHAGIDPRSLRGSDAGVYAGISLRDYGALGPGALDELEGLRLTGLETSVVSGRVAYALGLEGTGLKTYTACSSSLVAIHEAAQALRAGECALALAGGVTVMATPAMFVEFSRQGGLAPDGRCKSFAAGADGTGWSEGVGLVVVERLSDAERLGHEPLALVRGSAINQDGASNGLTAPSGPAQERVIRAALASAALSPADVDAVEAHGTGTTLGDPIEAQALSATYGRERDGGPLLVGSLKSNVGHAQAAAGVGGVIKLVEALRHERLPRTLHVDEPSPHVDWAGGGLALLTEAADWPRGARPRRAGVSSFGISGTNAHVILEEPPARAPAEPPAPRLPLVPWLLSARSERALREQAERLRSAAAGLPVADVAHTLALRRAQLDWRAWVPGGDLDALGAIVPRRARPRPVAVTFAGGEPPEADGLRAAFPAYVRAHDEVLAELGPAAGDPEPARFALGVALYRLLESLGVRADFALGHGVGEVAAAHVAGALSLTDACRLVCARGGPPDALRAVAASLAHEPPAIGLVSSLTGAPVERLDADHWVRQADAPARFAEGVRLLADEGVGTFLELGRAGAEAVVELLAEAHVAGVDVDWSSLLPGRKVALPAYPFQRRRFWAEPRPDVSAAGLAPASHPLLGAVVPLAQGGAVLSGRLARATHPWLADRALHGAAEMPASALAELALRAGRELGLDAIEELTLDAPLELPARGAIEIQVSVDGERAVAIHARAAGGGWTRHARGTLAAAAAGAAPRPAGAPWPPPGAEPVAVERLYDELARAGLACGPAFRAVRAAWRAGETTFAELELDDERRGDAARFAIHPALLDAALHAACATDARVLAGVRVRRVGARRMRVRVERSGGALRVEGFDELGAAIVAIDRVAPRAGDGASGGAGTAHGAALRA